MASRLVKWGTLVLKQTVVGRWWLTAAAGLMLAGAALGHARLRSSVPAADAKLEVAPKALTLTFSEAARLAVLTLSLDGRDMPVAVDRSAPAALQVSVPIPALAGGKYLVQWSALSAADGHASKGSFTFEIAGAR